MTGYGNWAEAAANGAAQYFSEVNEVSDLQSTIVGTLVDLYIGGRDVMDGGFTIPDIGIKWAFNHWNEVIWKAEP